MKAALFGASGKIGRRALALLKDRGATVRALIHHTPLPEDLAAGVEIVTGSVTDPAAVDATVAGADIVLQMATTKEDPETFFDVSIKGTFHLLEACRRHRPRQFLLLGGDAAMGIWFYPHPRPIAETEPKIAYPGYYAFSKVIEETMTEQYRHQYGLATTILRSSWVFDNDDLLNHFSLLKNVNPAEKGHGFGQPSEATLDLVREGREHLPILLDRDGRPLRRHIVHIEDVIHALDRMIDQPVALNEDFNIAGPAAFDYRSAAACLAEKTGLPTVEIPCPDYHSFEIDISKARERLGYAPRNDFATMADRAIAWRAQS
ncbi:MAG: NAD(P)-dependent oxidoreductase [Verrucomicrobiales bacterium]|nr:NAD(P)-dependent oxidoreductase [Verrucomicrobiales bacterium]